MFARLQKALSLQTKNRVSLKKGVHQALEDFRWLASDLTSRPTRISELVPLLPGAEGQHDASGAGTGGVWFPGDSIPTRGTWKPGGLIHLDCVAQTLDTGERTLLSKGDNLNTTFWERKGSTTTDSAPAYLLRLFGIHQRFHRYVPRFDYIAGPSNPIADSLSRDFHLSMSDLISRLTHLFPQTAGYQVWTPPSKLRFCHNLRIAQETVTKGVSSSRAQKSISYYSHWIDFTTDLGLDPFLQAFSDKVPFLQVFGQRVRDGELACNKNSIKSRSVEDYIRAVAQAFLAMGSADPRLNSAGKMDFRIARMLAAWKKEDPPANRVKPIPIQVIRGLPTLLSTYHLRPTSSKQQQT
eukprot:CCRYP_019114-RC/>CCRYP_019114-RC protein AED:0.35 eAED:0.10 QI:0/0/0/1/0/0/2/0/352